MITIRRAVERDFSEILRIQHEAFSEYLHLYELSAWTKETVESLALDTKDKIVLVAERDGVLAGSVRFWMVAGVCVIRLLSVRPRDQGKGMAKALLLEIERMATEAHKFYACTMLHTSRNIGLFTSLGYRPEALMPNHYNHLDLICFAKYPARTAPAGASSAAAPKA